MVLSTIIFSCHSTKTTPASEAKSLPDNSRNALEWAGVYRGVLPCADCEGIQTELTLRADETYSITRKYLGKSEEVFIEQGRFIWDHAGGTITLQVNGEPDRHGQYRVGENKLAKLDAEGQVIQGVFAEKYRLAKVFNDPNIVEKYWKLIAINGQPIQDGNRNKEAHFILKVEGGKVFGNGGCNNFNGTYELKPGNRIHFSRLASTMMACEDVEIEGDFFKVFEMADNYSYQGDTLFLNKARMAPLARFEAVYFD